MSSHEQREYERQYREYEKLKAKFRKELDYWENGPGMRDPNAWRKVERLHQQLINLKSPVPP